MSNNRTEQGFKVEPYKFLSNMQPCILHINDQLWQSVETVYQASKAIDVDDREQFRTMNPYFSKKYGKKVPMRPDFDSIKLDLMEQLLRHKFSLANRTLRKKLIDTGDTELVEVNTWGDVYWGVCNNRGSNHLGKLLMKIRTELQDGCYGFSTYEWSIGEYVYNQLGPRTVNTGSRIIIRPWYGRDGVNKTKDIRGVFTLRVPDMEYHLGNPYSSDKRLVARDNLRAVDDTRDAVICFVCWCLFSYEDRAIQIRTWLSQDVLKNKPIVYYKELGEPSHATALEWLINNYLEDYDNLVLPFTYWD